LQAGFCRYLTKPIKVKELMDALDVALMNKRADAIVSQPGTPT
jgi:CheY-like chemotaxis protein